MSSRASKSERVDLEQLTSLRLFEGTDAAMIREQLERCEVRNVEEGTLILRPEQRDGSVYVVLEGRLSVHLGSPQGTAVALLDAGECAGELSFMDSKRPSAYVRAAQDTRLLVIGEEAMWDLVNTSHAVALNLLHMLARRVRHDNEVITSTTQRGERLEREAMVDKLTGSFNRRWMDEMFVEELGHCHAEGRPACVVMIDIDHFKQYNDTQGHQGGDRALICVARVLRSQLRPDDMLARYGGEEFSVLLPTTQPDRALEVSERLRRAVEGAEIFNGDGKALPRVTISLGVATCPRNRSLNASIEAADRALYSAKENGRNQACLAD